MQKTAIGFGLPVAAPYGRPGQLRTLTKTLFVMRLTIVLLTVAFVQVHAAGTAQSVTCSGKSLSLKQVFTMVKQQTGYVVFSNRNALEGAKPVSVSASNMPLHEFLALVLKDQPVDFMIKDKTIVLTRKSPALATPAGLLYMGEAPPLVSGSVRSADGHPLPGAAVRIKGSTLGTATDNEGHFNIAAAAGQTLLVSYTGYQEREYKITGAGPVLVVLELQDSPLDEVQIIAYGTTTRRLNTGAVSKVTAAEIARQPVSNPILALQGRMSGVLITENSGVAGSDYNIVIQGQNSINAGKLPLYIIDGVPFGSKPVDQSSGSYLKVDNYVNGNGFSPLNSLSPNDIESIEVLKDADATAIYGSRAANGVILITTKKGKAGKTKLDLDLYSGFSQLARTLPMLDASQFLAMRRQAFAYDHLTPDAVNAPDLTVFNTGGNQDFQKALMGRTGHFTNVTAAVSGGNEYTRFIVSGNFRRETPVFDGPFSDQKMQVRFNIQHRSANDRFNMTASASYAYDNNQLPPLAIGDLYNLPPNLPLYKGGDSLAFYTGYSNPASPLKSIYANKTNSLLSNLSLNYHLLPGLSFKTDLGYNRIEVNAVNATLRASQDPASPYAGAGSNVLNNNYNESYLVEPQLNYNTGIGRGKIQALAGGTWQFSRNVQPYFIMGTFTKDALYNDLASLIINSKQSGLTEAKYASLFGRLNYTLDDKYVMNISFRRDGSSRFSPGRRYGNFGSAGAAWIFSKEKWTTGHLW
jgi:TonB-linked SusC/RagA family outer membrane protein